ncbi:group II intron reverse transcriptase/maturase [Actinoplanes sp. NBRC 103695]|uniref:group II intron reverse transcriptase/maturase n=1 Tax=Actinoplanes sp. NBRC 103695 TaxID=3032202 RepID=UPI0024A1C127|nr:group II intron reverse transcriptase/maturase [Actinoplanes sp. NBRC 103695]GLZ02415.1 hypothetical protein Acsp02_96660 [Actinoplanes sp. NBRC 103695]
MITHARTQAAKFLGYEVTVHHNDRKVTRGRRSANGVVGLRVPSAVIKAKSAPYLERGKPERQARLINEDDHTIVNAYAAEYRGTVQYYLLAGNVARLYRLHWVMETSLLKTLAKTKPSPAADHARQLFETARALTDTGRAYNSVGCELGLNWRTVRKYAAASTWQECMRRPRPRVPSPLDRYLSISSSGGARASTAPKCCMKS